jgi:hypothetical protein
MGRRHLNGRIRGRTEVTLDYTHVIPKIVLHFTGRPQKTSALQSKIGENRLLSAFSNEGFLTGAES